MAVFWVSLFSCISLVFGQLGTDPEVYQSVIEIIRDKNYTPEEHVVQTKDGYLLTLHRILPKIKLYRGSSQVVLLQHGLLDSAHTWINNPPQDCLGFILADKGYDVWMGNSRGNTYSRGHIHLSLDSYSYWRFSWDEMVDYDLPATIDYILNITKSEKLYYVGHSQGTAIAFARLNEDSELRSRVLAVAALAPIAYTAHIKGAFRYIEKFCWEAGFILAWLGHGEFLPSSSFIRFLDLLLCRAKPFSLLCKSIIFMIEGYDTANTNLTRLPVYLAHTPAGTSVQNMLHYCQNVRNGRFGRYDFGRRGNIKNYHQDTPPDYGLSNLSLPIKLYWGGEDWLSTPKDVSRLISELPKGGNLSQLFLPSYDHLDFVWGVNAASLIYSDLIDYLQQY